MSGLSAKRNDSHGLEDKLRRTLLQALAAAPLFAAAPAWGAISSAAAFGAVRPFALSDVQPLDGPFKAAKVLDARYLLSLNLDRLLHNTRVNAGLPPKASEYRGWESQEPWISIRCHGHTLGHYLSACAMMWAITGEARYLRLAERFNHRALLDPLAERRDTLDGLHANTQIPKVIGFARLHELTGAPRYQRAAQYFWNTVLARRCFATGGLGDVEHFFPPAETGQHLQSAKTMETCCTHNRLRLTRALFTAAPSAAYADYYERALLNGILASQDPETGMFTYFQMKAFVCGIFRVLRASVASPTPLATAHSKLDVLPAPDSERRIFVGHREGQMKLSGDSVVAPKPAAESARESYVGASAVGSGRVGVAHVYLARRGKPNTNCPDYRTESVTPEILVDINGALAQPDGRLSKDLMPELLHANEKGCAIGSARWIRC
ncbi:beta-L-arabinofuranosidase domain-containing protein [Hydrocarboniphaga sp.]|uniref:beta-L-arabinofuranosidase domain-containing protein n=1 Tax=Hydrocarboniphaga sp. TaxID=2033016 RepID=UPI003D0CAC46